MNFNIRKPDITSYQNVLQACANDSSLKVGTEISEELKQSHTDWLNDPVIQTNLIDLYGKCGYLTKCDQLFEEIKREQFEIYQNEMTIWNAMIHAYGRNGNLDKVKELFNRLKSETNLYFQIDKHTLIY